LLRPDGDRALSPLHSGSGHRNGWTTSPLKKKGGCVRAAAKDDPKVPLLIFPACDSGFTRLIGQGGGMPPVQTLRDSAPYPLVYLLSIGLLPVGLVSLVLVQLGPSALVVLMELGSSALVGPESQDVPNGFGC
jgi:hypothetical protein